MLKEKILFFIETGGPGGAEQVVLQLLEGFKNLGHEVALTTLRTGWLTETAIERGFSYYQIKSESGLDFALPFKLAKLIRDLQANVLHTHLLDSNFYGALAATLSGVSHVGTEHGDVHHINKKKFLKLKLFVSSIWQSKLTAVSKFSADKLIELGVNKKKVFVVPNPLKEPAHFSERSDIRSKLGANKEWLWLHVGNLRPVKDQTTLIKGFARSVNETSIPQKLVLVGDGPERIKLEQLVTELNIENKVVFIGHSNEVEKFLAAGDGFIMTSVSESMPMALLEAISYSLYPVCSSVGGIPEVLSVGHLFNVGDSEELGRLISKVVGSPDKPKEIANTLSLKLREERSLNAVCKLYLELYGR